MAAPAPTAVTGELAVRPDMSAKKKCGNCANTTAAPLRMT